MNLIKKMLYCSYKKRALHVKSSTLKEVNNKYRKKVVHGGKNVKRITLLYNEKPQLIEIRRQSNPSKHCQQFKKRNIRAKGKNS